MIYNSIIIKNKDIYIAKISMQNYLIYLNYQENLLEPVYIFFRENGNKSY